MAWFKLCTFGLMELDSIPGDHCYHFRNYFPFQFVGEVVDKDKLYKATRSSSGGYYVGAEAAAGVYAAGQVAVLTLTN